MAKNYLLYGFLTNEIDEIASYLSNIIGIEFVPHESYYRHGNYYRWEDFKLDSSCILQQNQDNKSINHIDYFTEPNFKEYKLLLYVEEASNSSLIETKMRNLLNKKAVLLKKQIIED